MMTQEAQRALSLYERGRYPQACRAFADLLASKPGDGALHRAYGLALRESGRPGEAIEQLKLAVVQDRDMASMKALAETLHISGQLIEARTCLEAMLARDPESADIYCALGAVAADLREDDKAAALLHEALQRAPDHARALTLFGIVGFRLGFVAAARAALLKAIETVPEDHDSLLRLADALCQTERHEEGLALYDRALALKPRSLPALGNRGAALLAMGRPQDALACLQKANSLQPDTPRVINLLIQAHRNCCDVERALKFCAHAIKLDPKNRDARSHHATLMLDRGFARESLAEVQALRRELPDDPELERFESLVLLLLGDFGRGWERMESRLRFGLSGRVGQQVAPPWRGEPLEGKRVMVTGEEGFGDNIQFIRYAALLAARGAVVGARAPVALQRLFARADGVAEFYPDFVQPPEDFDYDIKLLSLPLVFGTTLENVPAATPYLHVDEEDVGAWRERLSQDGRLRVGLVWAGNPKHQNDHNRSIKWGMARMLAECPGAAFYSLQVGPSRAQYLADPCGVVDLTEGLRDYYDTAGAVSALDLIVAVDTSLAHLAGALGKPGWTLLPYSSDWRWMIGREDSPWYPTMRLFRQSAMGDWAGVIARVKAAIESRNRLS